MRINAHSFAQMMHMLFYDSVSRDEIVEETGLHPNTVREYTRELKRARVIRIADWQADAKGAMTVCLFRVGSAKDAPKPAPKSAVERQQKYREKQRQIAMIRATAGRAP